MEKPLTAALMAAAGIERDDIGINALSGIVRVIQPEAEGLRPMWI
jgi:hypothetical protein